MTRTSFRSMRVTIAVSRASSQNRMSPSRSWVPRSREIATSTPPAVVFRSRLEPTLFDYQTVEYKTTVAAGKRVDLMQEIVRHQGRNAKQNNVTLEAGDASAK